MTEPQSSNLSLIRRWINRIFILVVLLAMAMTVSMNFAEIQSFNWRIQPVFLILAVIVYLGFFLVRGITWIRIIIILANKLSWRSGLRIYIYTYISRYIPGGIWFLVTLNTTAHNLGLSKRTSTFALLFQILLGVVVDVLYFLPLIHALIGIIGVLIYSIFIYIFPVFIRLGFNKLSKLKLVPESANLAQFTVTSNIFQLFILTIIHQIFQLSSYFIFIYAVMEINTSQIMYLTLAYAISWLIGFLVIFAPQGLGIREIVFVFLTAPLIPPEISVALSIALRLLTVISEFAAFFLFLIYDKFLVPPLIKQ